MVESMLQHDGDDVAGENNGNYTLECTDYNHSPSITNFNMAGEETNMGTDATNTEQATNPSATSSRPPGDNFTRDNFGTDTNELELSDNYLTFLA